MNVLCTDGTSFRCDRYELTEKGVKLYSGDTEEEPDRYESDTDEHQIGFVPDAMLRYILPEGVRPAPTAPSVVPPAGHRSQPSTAQQPQGLPTAQSPQRPTR